MLMEISIKALGKMIKEKVLVRSHGKMGMCILVNLKMELFKELALLFLKMAINMKDRSPKKN